MMSIMIMVFLRLQIPVLLLKKTDLKMILRIRPFCPGLMFKKELELETSYPSLPNLLV